MEAKLRDVPTVEALVEHVRQGVEEIVREALAEAEHLREEADEKLERYDGITSELAALRLEKHSLKHELQDLPARVHVAALDSLAVSYVGEDPDSLQSRYVTARERLPVVEARIGRLENELANLVAGGSRPAKVRNERLLLKHKVREPALDTLNDAAQAVEALRESLPVLVEKAAEDLIRERKRVRDGQTQLWGQAKAAR
jgi:predicted  nucleic acid-binding Zn-ribbon protein